VAGASLLDRLRGGALDPDDALQVTLDTGRELAVVHARGVAHGRIDPAAVALGDGARLPPASSDGSQREDLRGLGRILHAALTGVVAGPGALLPPERLRAGLPGDVRDAVGWLLHPDDAHGAQAAGDAVRTLEALRCGQPVELETPPEWPTYVAPLAAHRVLLRMVCQGAAAAVAPVPVLLVTLAPLEAWPATLALTGAFGALVTLAEELLRANPRAGLLIAVVAAAASPLLALGVAVVAAAVLSGRSPHQALEALVVELASGQVELGWIVAGLFLPTLAFVLARIWARRAPSPTAVGLAAVAALPSGPAPLAVLGAAVGFGGLALAFTFGRWVELLLAGRPR